MKVPKHNFKGLTSQQLQIELKRREIIRKLYQMVDELEGRPLRGRSISQIPFDMAEGAIYKALNVLENQIDRVVVRTLKRLKKHLKRLRRSVFTKHVIR